MIPPEAKSEVFDAAMSVAVTQALADEWPDSAQLAKLIMKSDKYPEYLKLMGKLAYQALVSKSGKGEFEAVLTSAIIVGYKAMQAAYEEDELNSLITTET